MDEKEQDEAWDYLLGILTMMVEREYVKKHFRRKALDYAYALFKEHVEGKIK